MTELRAYTPEEVQAQLLDSMRMLARYWETAKGPETVRERLDGLAFSILNIFDGTSQSMPSIDLVLRPHPDDKADSQESGENWYEAGQIINADVYLHDLWYQGDSHD